jgi:hypothetical protein
MFDKIFIEYGVDIFVIDYKALPRIKWFQSSNFSPFVSFE